MTPSIHHVAPLPMSERSRLDALRLLRILDSQPEGFADDTVGAAARIAGSQYAAMSFVDAERQWFKSCIGLDIHETDRDDAFCAHTILADTPLIVPDATIDLRFSRHPFVVGDLSLRFYAGFPITVFGEHIGALCVFGDTPCQLRDAQIEALSRLAQHTAEWLQWPCAA